MANKIYLETQKPVDGLGRLFNQPGPADLPIPEGSNVYLEGTSLVIPEQERPEPIIEIDGVSYCHKCEFDLEAILESQEVNEFIMYDLLTGEVLADRPEAESYFSISRRTGAPGNLVQLYYTLSSVARVYTDPKYMQVDYVSKAFTPVDTFDEVTYGQDEICLPTCSAYYGYLSENGKTFISYYNLKSESIPEYIDSIKQGNAVIPIKPMGGNRNEALRASINHGDKWRRQCVILCHFPKSRGDNQFQ